MLHGRSVHCHTTHRPTLPSNLVHLIQFLNMQITIDRKSKVITIIFIEKSQISHFGDEWSHFLGIREHFLGLNDHFWGYPIFFRCKTGKFKWVKLYSAEVKLEKLYSFFLPDVKQKRKLLAGAVLVTSLIHLTAKLSCLQLFYKHSNILKSKRRQNNCPCLASNILSLDKR